MPHTYSLDPNVFLQVRRRWEEIGVWNSWGDSSEVKKPAEDLSEEQGDKEKQEDKKEKERIDSGILDIKV